MKQIHIDRRILRPAGGLGVEAKYSVRKFIKEAGLEGEGSADVISRHPGQGENNVVSV